MSTVNSSQYSKSDVKDQGYFLKKITETKTYLIYTVANRESDVKWIKDGKNTRILVKTEVLDVEPWRLATDIEEILANEHRYVLDS